nr:MAG: hypothetical protein 1 [Leviviridae sp.]
MPPRNRFNATVAPKGERWRFGTPVGGGFIETERNSINDIYGETADCQSLWIEKWKVNGGVINNDYYSFWAGTFVNYRADALQESNFGHLDLESYMDIPNNNEAATSAAARTSPSKAYVDLTANMLELFDIAHMIRSYGETLIKKVARGNLALEFGMKPIVGDLAKLLVFQEQVDRRVQVLQKLRDTGSYRKTVVIGAYERFATANFVAQSADAFIMVPKAVHTMLLIKAHCRWIPSVDMSKMTNPTMGALARRAIVHRGVDFAALWEAMPWSWLLDWCGNVGQFLAANRNTVPATLSGVSIMRHTKTIHTTPSFSDPSSGNRFMEPISSTRETKLRQGGIVSPSAHWPFLSASQMGILASLSVR